MLKYVLPLLIVGTMAAAVSESSGFAYAVGGLRAVQKRHRHGYRMPYSYHLSCDAARELVEVHGAIVIRTGPYTYDRYVAHQGYCDRLTETTRPAWIPTNDAAECFVGYRCVQDNRGGGGG